MRDRGTTYATANNVNEFAPRILLAILEMNLLLKNYWNKNWRYVIARQNRVQCIIYNPTYTFDNMIIISPQHLSYKIILYYLK